MYEANMPAHLERQSGYMHPNKRSAKLAYTINYDKLN
jgi:hypothetical protein